MLRILATTLLLAAAGDASEADKPVASLRKSAGQYATIRPTHRLVGQESRTTRKSPTIPGMPLRKSGNISPLQRELPKTVVQPPKSRRRQVGW